MRYKLAVDENGKLRTAVLGGNRLSYIAVDEQGGHTIVNRNWVTDNIDYISNAGISAGRVYAVKDQFNKAVLIIQKDMTKRLISKIGIEITNNYKVVKTGKLIKRNKLPSKATSQEAWEYINHFGVNSGEIFKHCLRATCQEQFNNNKKIYAIRQSNGSYRIYTDNEAVLCKQNGTASIVIHNADEVLRLLG